MKTKIQTLTHNSHWLLTKLQAHPTQEGVYQTTLNFSSYVSLMATIADLVKLCALAKLADEPHISPLVGTSPIDIAGILELALQLMPHSEAEFLDEARNILTNSEPEPMPLFNYSTIVVLES
jgi:hypothetical protein